MGGAVASRLNFSNGLEYCRLSPTAVGKFGGVVAHAQGSFSGVYIPLVILKLSVVDQSQIAVAMERPKASERFKTSSEVVNFNWL
jgi:hypothetical protein